MSDNTPLNPVDLENQILNIKNACHRGVDIFSEKHTAFLAAELECEHAESQAYLSYDGPQFEKRHAARAAVYELRKIMNRAKVELRYTEKKLDALMAELFALQNLNKSVRAMYNAEKGFGG
jgi:hypothetical protein